jgi:hypothetical protein
MPAIDFDEALALKRQEITPEMALRAYVDAVAELQALYPDADEGDCHDCIQREAPRVWRLAMQAIGG